MNSYATNSITTAGLALALGILGADLWRWYKGGAKGKDGDKDSGGSAARDPKALIPLAFGIVCGILMVGCPAGLLGKLGGILRWGGNGLGGTIMQTLTGKGGTNLATAAAPTVDEYGAPVVAALFIGLWLVRKQIAKLAKGKWKKGVFIGVMLCISTGTAAIVAQTVVGGANNLGHQVFSTITTGTLT
ncbi:hypothetical protein [Streptomyces murinus]|uniref:hypothetical protein n=1 Tax=Streptomyces murinus TaxID=33900 RepID=UPI0038249DDB